MQYDSKQPDYLKKPLIYFLVNASLFAVGITALFLFVEKLLPVSGNWQPYVAALPGIGLCTSLVPVYLYVRHQDEFEKRRGVKALAISAIGGIVALVISLSRAQIGGYAELNGSLVLAIMGITFVGALLILNWRGR